jgi:hypothetical protein
MYSSYSLFTSALDRGEWSASRPGRALPEVLIVQEAGWASELVWTQRLEKNSFAWDRTPVDQCVIIHLNDRAIIAPSKNLYCVAINKFTPVHTSRFLRDVSR